MVDLTKKAKQIANLIKDVPTETRGELLIEIAHELQLRAQIFTGQCLFYAGQKYNGK